MIGSRLFVILLTLLVSLLACSKKQDVKPPPPAMKVGVVAVDVGNIDQTLDVSGTLTFIANTTVSSEVSAQVQSIEVSDGQAVQEDQLLLVFDETKIKETANQALANLQKDEATLSFNKTEWQKNLGLLKTGSISQTQYDQKLSLYQNSLGQVEADRAAFAKARQDLKKTRLKAPIMGLLSNRYVEKGDWVSEGGKLFQISDYSRIYLESFLSDVDVGKLDIKKVVAEGVDADVTVDSYPGKTFKGRLSYIQPMASQARLFQIRIYLENQEMVLLQGMFARGRTVVKTIPGAIRVPTEALIDQIRNNDYNTVFVVDAGKKAKLQRIKIGDSNPRYAHVITGLKQGDLVVTRGKEILATGQPLEITESSNPESM